MSGEFKRLDQQFGWNESEELKNTLRLFTKAIEARLGALDIVVATVPEAVALMREIALTRINEVLQPAYAEITEIIEQGFPSSRIADSGVFGRSILAAPDRDTAASALAIKAADIVDAGAFGRSLLQDATRADALTLLALAVGNISGAAPLASPTFTGVPAAPTAVAGTNTTQLATTAFVAALGALKANLASPTFTGTPAAPTAAAGTNTTQLATTAFVAALGALKADLASPTFTGLPLGPTANLGTNTTQLATTAFVYAVIGNLINSAPAALDTLQELANALGNDPDFATTVTNALSLKAPIDSPTFQGVPAAPTAAAGTNTTQLATTAFVAALGALKANLASPTFTGVPAAPTAAAGTNTTQLATTAFVAALGALKLNISGGELTGILTTRRTSGAIANSVGALAGLNILSNSSTDAAFASFNRLNTYAAYFGIDTDNKWKVGGWSMGANAYEVWHSGTFDPASKANLASPTFTGVPAAPTAAAGTNTTQLATTAFVAALGALKANLASPTFTGTPTMPALQVAARDVYGSHAYGFQVGQITIPSSGEVVVGSIDFTAQAVQHLFTAFGSCEASGAVDILWRVLIRDLTAGQDLISTNAFATASSAGGFVGVLSYALTAGLTLGKNYRVSILAAKNTGATAFTKFVRCDVLGL